jgi:hypothetical protein
MNFLKNTLFTLASFILIVGFFIIIDLFIFYILNGSRLVKIILLLSLFGLAGLFFITLFSFCFGVISKVTPNKSFAYITSISFIVIIFIYTIYSVWTSDLGKYTAIAVSIGYYFLSYLMFVGAYAIKDDIND